jgi:glycosyltransferase involved in cell wall biosynthesis
LTKNNKVFNLLFYYFYYFMEQNILASQKKYPAYSFTGYQHEYILITSLNLGGAEKIVTDQLWANSWNKQKIKYTLIVLYEKDKEHPVPEDVNIVRLNGHLENGNSIFAQISHENKTLVAHLVNDKVLEHLFTFNIRVNLVLHNDQQGWVNKPHMFNHPNMGALVAVCHYVERQIRQYTDKPIITLRHQINYRSSLFNEEKREFYRNAFKIGQNDKVIGMLGRIAWQKNYAKAIEILYHLKQKDSSWKLMIVGGFEPIQQEQYIHLLKLTHYYGLQNDIIFTGFRNDAKEIINCFDIALNTSHFEGLSMATQELIGNGLKIFCANVCGQEEILDEKGQISFYSVSEQPENVAQLIINNTCKSLTRELHTEDELLNISARVWSSHRTWNLLQHAGQKLVKNDSFAFLTSNFNLGGAQKSLVNLTKELHKNNIYAPVIVANQSNYLPFYQNLIEDGIEVFLAQNSIDAFDITNSIFDYLKSNNISKLLLWNVDSKLRLLLTKIGTGWLDIVDVSPGHYCFEEMLTEKNFMQGIYFDEVEYHKKMNKMVFKYSVDKDENPYYELIKDKTYYIPNGVYLGTSTISSQDLVIIDKMKSFKKQNPDTYNFVVCGRVSPSKHIDIIFKAFEEVAIKNNINLFIVGSVEPEYIEYYNKLHNKFGHLFNKKIFFLGLCDNSQNILPYFDNIIVIGTHQGCPNVVLEAMASKVSVIANSSGGTKELVNENTGILLPEIFSNELLVKSMEQAINSTEQSKVENAYNLIKNNFSMKKMMDSYLEILR